MKVLVTQSCPTLCDPVDCSLPGSFFHGILQARILVATFPSSGNLPDPGMEPGSPALQADSLPSEPPGKPQGCQGRPPLFHPLPAVSATTGHRKATDKGPARVPWSQQQNLLETACSVREEVVEHRKGGESPIKAISSTSCPSGRPGALGWGRPPLAGTQDLPGTFEQLETD